LPVLADRYRLERGGQEMSRVIVGVDPHKKSVTIEVVDEHGAVLAEVDRRCREDVSRVG
jgi:hypothetical protein